MKKLFTYGTDYRFGSRGSDRFPQPFPRCCRLRYQTARKRCDCRNRYRYRDDHPDFQHRCRHSGVGTDSGDLRRLQFPSSKGQLLALIDPSSFESNVAKEKANLEVAKAQVLVAKASRDYYKKHLERITKLNKQSYSADKELDEAQKDYDTSVAQMALYQAQVEQAQAALDYNLIQLGYTKIISPVDGMIVSKNIEAGQTVAASFETPTLFNVAEDLTKMKIEASVVEADIAKSQGRANGRIQR